MLSFRRKGDPYMLLVGMTGVKMGDRILQIGCADGSALAAVASKVGLSGRALAVVPDDAAATRVRKGASQQGVLVEVELSPSTHLPIDDGSFDLVIVDDTAGQFAGMDATTRLATVREALRALRPGGRGLVISALPATGLAAMLGRGATGPVFDAMPALEEGGFRVVRLLAEREQLRFVEGMKARVERTA
jgi:ubiquinone/menaquinone biosynthesis C-methylase UbiE